MNSNPFEITLSDYDQAAFIPRLVGDRLVDRLKWFETFDPKTILDVGCRTGHSLERLHHHYHSAQLVGIDTTHALLTQAQHKTKHHARPPVLVTSDIYQPLFKHAQFDLIWANLSLLWVPHPAQYLSFLYALLKPGGLLLISLLGANTFQELRTAHHTSPSPLYPWAFCDIHPIGDQFVAAQFNRIVMEADPLTFRYDNIKAVYHELVQLGLHTLLPASPIPMQDNECIITWDIIYGQAWKPIETPNTHTSDIIIPIQDIRRPFH